MFASVPFFTFLSGSLHAQETAGRANHEQPASSSKARTPEILLTGPLKAAPSLLLFREATPAHWEWVYWTSVGASSMGPGDWGVTGGLGAEITYSAFTYPDFPSGRYRRRLSRGEFRFGPWANAATRADGGLVEGGLKMHLGATYHASFGTYDVRFGGGYGAFGEEREPHLTLTLAYGARSALHRYSSRGSADPPPKPRTIAMASVARPFFTYRGVIGDSDRVEVVIGLELSPTYFLPPYGWFRWAGGPPR